MDKDIVYVTGFIGSRRREKAEEIAKEKGFDIVDLDKEIEKKKNMSVKRLCMMMGEHGYRNEEYEILAGLEGQSGIVVVCGDGVVFDDMCVEIMKKGTVVIADADSERDELFKRAVCDESVPYAFMMSGDENEKYEKFCKMYDQRKPLYDRFC